MNALRKKVVFAIVTLVIIFAVIEGSARLIWWGLEWRALRLTKLHGTEALRGDAIHFMKEPDALLGYTLKPGNYGTSLWISSQRFPQRDIIPVTRRPGYLRIACLGESTTFGNSSVSNYPVFLRGILDRDGHDFRGYEVINAGVPGWDSDQVERRTRREIAPLKPDVAILYVGWNDFQSYDPLAPPPQMSNFETYFSGASGNFLSAHETLKSIALLSELYRSRHQARPATAGETPQASQTYRFLTRNLDRIVADLRGENPGVKIFICTLVGRWPVGTSAEWAAIPGIWWMTNHHITPDAAPAWMERINGQLRAFASTRSLSLIDLAAAFGDLDRSKLQYDWAHMTSEGYELMAWNMFTAMEKEGIVHGQEDTRYAQLLAQFRMVPSAVRR